MLYFMEESILSEMIWKKAVVTLYRERYPKIETEPFAVIKTKAVTINIEEKEHVSGHLEDFFALMGDVDYISSPQGSTDKYVLCWFDNSEEDTTKDLRRLTGVTFPKKVSYTLTESGKRTYNADFKATHAKLK